MPVLMILRQAMIPVLAGLGAGLSISFATGRLLAGLLFGVAPMDFVTITAVPALLAAVAMAASYIPACRATRIDPLAALRHE